MQANYGPLHLWVQCTHTVWLTIAEKMWAQTLAKMCNLWFGLKNEEETSKCNRIDTCIRLKWKNTQPIDFFSIRTYKYTHEMNTVRRVDFSFWTFYFGAALLHFFIWEKKNWRFKTNVSKWKESVCAQKRSRKTYRGRERERKNEQNVYNKLLFNTLFTF